MQIAKDQLIAGQPALKVRSFVRAYRILSFYTSEFEKLLNFSPAEAEDFAHEMVSLGFLTQTTYCPVNNRPVYQVGDQGHMLANASAAKLITRKTADRVLQEFMERVRIVNASTLYAYKVETAVLFGSMLSDKERLGDVDIAIELRAATKDRHEFQELLENRWIAGLESDKLFRSNFELLAWPETEVRFFLKSRSRSLSLHRLGDFIEIGEMRYRVLHGDSDQLATLIPNGRPS